MIQQLADDLVPLVVQREQPGDGPHPRLGRSVNHLGHSHLIRRRRESGLPGHQRAGVDAGKVCGAAGGPPELTFPLLSTRDT